MSISTYVKLKPGYTMADVLGAGPASVKLATAWQKAKDAAWERYCNAMNSGKDLGPADEEMTPWSLNSPASLEVQFTAEQAALVAGYTLADRVGAAKLLAGGLHSDNCACVGGRALAIKYGERDAEGMLESGNIPKEHIPAICDELGWFGLAAAVEGFYYG
jgi:hypothetical protein